MRRGRKMSARNRHPYFILRIWHVRIQERAKQYIIEARVLIDQIFIPMMRQANGIEVIFMGWIMIEGLFR